MLIPPLVPPLNKGGRGDGYENHEQWLADWQNYHRSSQFTLVGSKDETNRNQNCQLLSNGTLKIRVPKCYESLFGKYYVIENVGFTYGQKEVEYALNNQQALTFRFVRKEERWYVFCSLEVPIPPTPLGKGGEGGMGDGMIGVDLNPSVIGWSFWNALSKKLKGRKRHSFFSVANSEVEVTLLDESNNRFKGKSFDTSTVRRDSRSTNP